MTGMQNPARGQGFLLMKSVFVGFVAGDLIKLGKVGVFFHSIQEVN